MISSLNLHVSWKPVNPQDLRMGESLPTHHEDHIAGKGENSLQHYNLVHKFIPMPQAMKIPAAKSSSGAKMGEIGKDSGVGPDESQKQIGGDRWSKDKGHKSSFCLTDGYMSFWRNAELEAKYQKYKGRAVLRCDIVKDDSGSYAVFTEQGIISITNDSSKSHGYHIQIAWLRKTSSWRSVCWNSFKKWKMLQNFWKFQNRNVQTFGFVYHDTIGRNHGPVWKIQSYLREICMVILWQDCYRKGNLRKTLLKHGWAKVSNSECLFVHRDKGLFRSLCVDDIKLAGKKQNIDPNWKYSIKKLIWENQHLWKRVPGIYSKTMWNKQRHRWQLQSHVWIQNFRRSNSKITMLGKSEYLFVAVWHGRSCQEMCGTILWVGRQDDSTTLQSIYFMPWRPSFQRKIEIRGRLVTSMLKLFKNAHTWHVLEDLIFHGQWKKTCKIDHKMDQSLWQTIMSFDLLHSSYMWLQTILSCGKHCQTMEIGTVSRLRFCKRSWGFKIYVRRSIVRFF